MFRLPKLNPWISMPTLVAFLLVIAMACGSEPTATTTRPTEAPAATDPPAATAAPAVTAVPQPAAQVGRFPEAAFSLLKASEPNPKRGGIFRFGFAVKPAHFDIHQSGTALNIDVQGPMYDNLLRLHPISAQREIIPDLAHSWDISDDGLTYTFYLREGVKFHDGAILTSEDVKATFDRIIFPPEGVTIPREAIFKASAVKDIRAPDPLTVEFVLAEPRPSSLVLAAISAGWNVIVRKQTLEDNNFDLKRVQDYPGTGPFKFQDFREGEFLKMEANKDYWNPELPYLDGIEVLHLGPWEPEMGAALLAGRVDYVRALEMTSFRRADEDPDIDVALFPQPLIFAMWMNNTRKPLDDVRVRRAIQLVLDREALIQVTIDVFPASFGAGFIYRDGKFSTPIEELKQRPGYRSPKDQDIQEAQRLLVEAGYPNGEGIPELDFLVRQAPHFELQAAAIQEMLRTSLNIKSKIETTHVSVWFEDAERGDFDLTISAVAMAVKDPSDYFRAWYGTGGPQNYSKWENAEFEGFLDKIDRELDTARRTRLIRDAELIMEEDPPLIPVAWAGITDAWWKYVKGVDPKNHVGIYDVVRFDTVWLDK
jgi:peptide/nickel transport system substrate-binding protein